jgi:glycosyltransferase involved in cell wall biosynthesis
MRIALTVNFSPWSRYRGGGQRSTHQLASALARRGHDVTVVFTRPPWESISIPSELPYHVRWAALFDLTSRRAAPLRPLSALSVARSLRELSRERALSVVHSQGEEGALAQRAARCPVVLTARYPSYPPALLTAGLPRAHRAWHLLRDPKYLALAHAARAAALVCATSRSSAAMVQRALHVDAARLRVVPNGVDPSFLARARRPDAARGPLLFFGRIEYAKGVDVLLEAFARSRHRERTLCVVGEGDALPGLRRAIRERALEARVELQPWHSAEALSDRLAGAAVAVLPSREESFGNAMVEAMAAGTPLITTSVGSLPELVRDGETGVLVPADDAESLRHAIDSLLADPARAEGLGRSARAHAEAAFCWDAVAQQYEAIYAEAAACGNSIRVGAGPEPQPAEGDAA